MIDASSEGSVARSTNAASRRPEGKTDSPQNLDGVYSGQQQDQKTTTHFEQENSVVCPNLGTKPLGKVVEVLISRVYRSDCDAVAAMPNSTCSST